MVVSEVEVIGDGERFNVWSTEGYRYLEIDVSSLDGYDSKTIEVPIENIDVTGIEESKQAQQINRYGDWIFVEIKHNGEILDIRALDDTILMVEDIHIPLDDNKEYEVIWRAD